MTIHTVGAGGMTLQAALDAAQSGDTIEVRDGVYDGEAVTRRDGTPVAPITIRGSRNAVIRGRGTARMIEVNHDYYVIEGLTLDGYHGRGGTDGALIDATGRSST